jgi:TPR repeat protein
MVASAMTGKGEAFGSSLVYSVWLAAYALCGWFIIQRKRWAWVLGTVLSFNILVWIINYIYGRNRWGEFGGQAYDSAGTEDEGYELLNDATKLEAKGRAEEALSLYQRIVERYPHTAAGGDAQKSAESLRARLGVACPVPVEAATAPPLPLPQDSGRHPGCLSPVRPDGSRPNLEPELMAALATRSADIMDFGIRDFEPWAAKPLANLGETIASKVRPHLCQIYNAAQEEVRKRQGRLQATEGSPVPPAPSVGTQADSDTGQARPVPVAKPATEAPLICGQTNTQPPDEPPRQIPAPMGPRPKWRMRRLGIGTAAALAIIAGVVNVRMWRDGAQPIKPEALDWLADVRARAEKGDMKAQTSLALQYAIGNRKNYAKEAYWYRKAAEQGSAEAQYWFGLCYYKGEGVTQDYGEAVKWFRKAAEQGDGNGQWSLGMCYEEGQGVPKDYVTAVNWYRKAADQGDATAQFSLGDCYSEGKGVRQDYAEAIKWFQKAAEQEYPWAQPQLVYCYFKLADCYDTGKGVRQDYVEAAKWFRKGAEQGDADAQMQLGLRYEEGQGVPKDYGEAVKWYHRAAQQGDGLAQWCLGDCYAFGNGTPQNDIEAYKWCCLAAAQGYDHAAERRDWISQRMARAEIVEAQRRAAAYVAKKEGGEGGSGDTSPTPEIGEGKFVGTGFFVTEDGYFVTCEHVVRGATSFHVRSPSGSLPARLIKKDRTIDVAVLKVDGAFRALPVAAQPRVKLGEAVFTIGFPNPDVQGVEPKLTRGEISSMAGVQDNPRYYQISVPVQPGNSGGALLDECGNAVGVVTSRLDDVATYEESGALPQNVNYAVKGGLVYNFLSGVPELSGKLKAARTTKDREAASGAAERAAVLVVAE